MHQICKHKEVHSISPHTTQTSQLLASVWHSRWMRTGHRHCAKSGRIGQAAMADDTVIRPNFATHSRKQQACSVTLSELSGELPQCLLHAVAIGYGLFAHHDLEKKEFFEDLHAPRSLHKAVVIERAP